ncbi:putative bifunctional diguanylate cyclase/phosphodiesterase [Exiguobacterium flavidum]|uniref:putative bifunctional diguanylate cyclase/phosphodiesterase n=1 Tax=Exiguobacterium flavidum TaxID=2184695 RepID=UPI001E4B4859|nr:EAL domain-containing protein [Exiguobacterium flavidum]
MRRLLATKMIEAFRKRSYRKMFSRMILTLGIVALIVASQQLYTNLQGSINLGKSVEALHVLDEINEYEALASRYHYAVLNERVNPNASPISDMLEKRIIAQTPYIREQTDFYATDGPIKDDFLNVLATLETKGIEDAERFFLVTGDIKNDLTFHHLGFSRKTGDYYNLFSNMFLMEELFGSMGQTFVKADVNGRLEATEIDQIRKKREEINIQNNQLAKALYAFIPKTEELKHRRVSEMRNQIYGYLQTVDANVSSPNLRQYSRLDTFALDYQYSMYNLFGSAIKQARAEIEAERQAEAKNAWISFIVTTGIILSLMLLTWLLLRAFRVDLHLLKAEATNFSEGQKSSSYDVPYRNDFYPVAQAFRTMTTIISNLLDRNQQKTIELEQKTAEIESLFSQNTDPILALSSDFLPISGNERIIELLGTSELPQLDELIHPADINRFRKALRMALDGGSGRIRCKMTLGEEIRHMFVNIVHVTSRSESGVALYLTCHDETDQIKREEKITQLALYDSLTGLLNRNGFERKMTSAVNRSEAGELVTLSVRQFRRINDMYGHTYGDEVLRQMAGRLRRYFVGTASAARIGGDEFAILVYRQGIVDYADLKNQIELPYLIGQERINATISMSMIRYPDDAVAVTSLLSSADIAMQHAKRKQDGAPVWFETWMSEEYRESVVLETELREAIKHDELKLFYQPQINLQTGEVEGCEALLRWFHPERGMISPGVFIPIAERSMLIEELGIWVIEHTAKQALDWEDGPLNHLRISANLSVKELVSGRVVDLLDSIRKRHPGIEERIEIEITESVGVFSDSRVFEALNELSAMGYRLAIDDFGTGYSSLSYLSRLPIQRLKIDRSFISGEDACSNAPLIATIIKLAHTLKYDVVAEGIEQPEQGESLKELACEYGQGFYYSPPLPVEEFERWVAARA